MHTIDPASGKKMFEYRWMSREDVDARVATAHDAFGRWRQLPIPERGDRLSDLAKVLRTRASELAATITSEMGKPIAEAEAEIEKCAFGCEYYAQHAERFLSDEPAPSDSPNSVVAFEPLGVILAIMPWNFPFWQVFRHAAPALMAGNVILVKHAPNVPRCAYRIEEVFQQGLGSDGLVSCIYVDIDEVEAVIADPRVAAVTLTGSDRAGKDVASKAGRHLKKSVLELGGSDAFIVLDDADVDAAVEVAVKARFQNAGQSCIAAKRFIVTPGVADEFEAKLAQAVSKLKVGDPSDRTTQIGPLARLDLLENLERQVRMSLDEGARLVAGGERLGTSGFYFAPTILADVTEGMAVFDEETFGPVACVVRAADEDDAVSLANASSFGLGGNVWTRDLERGERIARRLETGGVFINGMTHSDPRLPFGGVKRSGYGRELSSFGIREFVNIKTIWKP